MHEPPQNDHYVDSTPRTGFRVRGLRMGLAIASVLAVSTVAYAQVFTTFEPGMPASASQINDNFSFVRNEAAARDTTLDTKIADLDTAVQARIRDLELVCVRVEGDDATGSDDSSTSVTCPEDTFLTGCGTRGGSTLDGYDGARGADVDGDGSLDTCRSYHGSQSNAIRTQAICCRIQ